MNYDLCETCEEYALSIHDKSHAFIKIRYPIQSIIKKPILPKFMPLGDVNKNYPSASTSTSSASTSQVQEMAMIDSPKLSAKEPTPEPSSIPTPLPVEPVLSAAFVSDINIPDGTLIFPKKIFIKVGNTLD